MTRAPILTGLGVLALGLSLLAPAVTAQHAARVEAPDDARRVLGFLPITPGPDLGFFQLPGDDGLTVVIGEKDRLLRVRADHGFVLRSADDRVLELERVVDGEPTGIRLTLEVFNAHLARLTVHEPDGRVRVDGALQSEYPVFHAQWIGSGGARDLPDDDDPSPTEAPTPIPGPGTITPLGPTLGLGGGFVLAPGFFLSIFGGTLGTVTDHMAQVPPCTGAPTAGCVLTTSDCDVIQCSQTCHRCDESGDGVADVCECR